MREIPILMRPEMARATNLDMKVETRRSNGLERINANPDLWKVVGQALNEWTNEWSVLFQHTLRPDRTDLVAITCPFGYTDDLLWVRENWNNDGQGGHRYVSDFPDHDSIFWKPSIHMHKVIARTWCQITDCCIERLHDITRDGAKDEGIDIFYDRCVYRIPSNRKGIMITTDDPVDAYINYVNTISGLTMKDNPWVWVIRYQVLSTKGKPSMNRKEVAHA